MYIDHLYKKKNNPPDNHCLTLGGSRDSLLYVNAIVVPKNIPPRRCLHMMNHGCGQKENLSNLYLIFGMTILIMLIYVSTEVI